MTEVVPPVAIDKLVEQYIKLRDTLKLADDAHAARTKAVREYKQLLDGKLMEALNLVGGESVKTDAGTVYRTTRRTATIADQQAFRGFIVGNNLFDLVDWKANAPATDDYLKSTGTLPPGINYSEAHTVGVRRS